MNMKLYLLMTFPEPIPFMAASSPRKMFRKFDAVTSCKHNVFVFSPFPRCMPTVQHFIGNRVGWMFYRV